ncbi:MAG: hypothetical protein AAGE92_13980, partial [Cyanobacteria bacterium P01_G01_bin.4]
QWRQLKAHEIAGQMFDNEYDLAMTVIEGMESRSQVGDYQGYFILKMRMSVSRPNLQCLSA